MLSDAVVKKIGKENPTAEDFANFKPSTEIEGRIQGVMAQQLKNGSFKEFYDDQIAEGVKYYSEQVDYNLNIAYDPSKHCWR